MANTSGQDNSVVYTATTSGIVANGKGIYALDYVATAYGSASIDFLIGGAYWAAHSMSAADHQIITIPPHSTFRVTITGGTAPYVRLTPLDHHTA